MASQVPRWRPRLFFYGSASTWPSADVHGRAIYRLRLSSSGFISFELLLSLSLTISYVQPRRNVGHRQRKVGNQNKIKKRTGRESGHLLGTSASSFFWGVFDRNLFSTLTVTGHENVGAIRHQSTDRLAPSFSVALFDYFITGPDREFVVSFSKL